MSAADTNSDPWADLVAMAQATVKKAEAGDFREAKEVIRQAAVALRDVLGGRMPDRERVEYLRFLLVALEQIGDGVKPAMALGIGETGRPNTISPSRDVWLFLAVGRKYQELNNVTYAINHVARKYRIGPPTVRKAWQAYGGKVAWRRCDPE